MPVDFKPSSSSFADRLCHGVQIVLIDRQALDPAELGVELAAALWKLYPDVFQLDKTLPLIGARWVLKAIEAGKDPRCIVYEWQGALEQFRTLRSKYLLYPEGLGPFWISDFGFWIALEGNRAGAGLRSAQEVATVAGVVTVRFSLVAP